MNLNNIIKKSIKESIVSYFYESKQTQVQKYGEDLVNKLLPLDPTKTYKYIEQICNYYNEGISEDEIKKYIDLYNTKLTKNLISKEYSNINKIKTFKDLKDIIDNKSIEISHTEFEDNLMKESYLTTITTNKGTFDIYRPYNTLQQIKIGKHTKWCISQAEYKNEFNKYFINNNIRFYLFIKRKNDNEKYQLNIYPNNKKEVWDILDKEIGCDEFKSLTDIDCKDYSWYPINQYIKDIIVYDQYGHKIGHMVNNKKEGEWIEYHDNGEIKTIIHYKDNIFDGEWIEYYKNGNIESIKHYKNGKLNGEYLEYYDNDKIHIKKYYKNDKLDGNYISYYENGNIYIKTYYNDGKLDGSYIEYYENGNIKIKTNYKNDKKDGEYFEYYENGNIELKAYYENGKLDGEYIAYYENGEIKLKIYYKNGAIDRDTYVSYYGNGDIRFKQYYKNGMPTDKLIAYDENGKELPPLKIINGKKEGTEFTFNTDDRLWEITSYKNGMKNGKAIGYHVIDGSIQYIKNYKNNKLDGEQIEYYDSGKIERKEYYKNDELNGKYIKYFENGNIKIKEYYKDDKENGEYIEYYENGNIYIKTNYKDDKLDGEYIEYDKNGNIKIKEYYKDNKEDGEYIKYDKNGNIIDKKYYKNGEEIKGEKYK